MESIVQHPVLNGSDEMTGVPFEISVLLKTVGNECCPGGSCCLLRCLLPT